MRLIDAEVINLNEIKFENGINEDLVLYVPYRDIQKYIDKQPTIEAKPVIHAHWEEYWDYNCMDYSYGCSNCGKDALTKEGTMYDQTLTEFCPFCGAQMDEKEDD